MNSWITNWKKIKIKVKKIFRKQPSGSEDADWKNCPQCKKISYLPDLISNFYICECNYHFDLPPNLRLQNLFDGSYELIESSENIDPEKILQADEIESLADAIEQRRMEEMKAKIQAMITASPTLSPFKNQLLLDLTTEGLRLQIVDQTNRPMFDQGSAHLRYYSEDILWELAPMLSGLDHRLQITGHTDSSGIANQRDEDDVNWGLSSLRADSARRALMEAGVPKSQIAQVIGMGDTAPLKPDDPAAAVNRRISITLLNKALDAGIKGRSGSDADVEFINGENGESSEDDPRTPTINRTGTLLEELQQRRNRADNPYDNPPNKEEVFW